jgi:(E)-4-hydroxy-3-methylbut-2-enyl-diphosphate synthase
VIRPRAAALCCVPCQKADDAIDLRNILHRDGSVISAVTLAQLATEAGRSLELKKSLD